MSKSVKVKLRFEGQQHQMDLDTLISSLLHFAELTRAASNDVIPGEKINIKIDATDKGSFEILLDLAAEAIKGILKYINWDSTIKVSAVVGLIVGFLEVKKFLKGKKPDNVIRENGRTTISINNSNITISEKVYNFYAGNEKANDSTESLFEKLLERPEIEGITIEAEGNEPFYAGSNEFTGMSHKNELVQLMGEKTETIETHVFVLKIVFQRKRKWEFIYQGNKISADVVDEKFWNKIDSSGIRFGKGDILTVKMEITQVFDSEANTYLNKAYKILEIIDYEQAQQTQMDFDK